MISTYPETNELIHGEGECDNHNKDVKHKFMLSHGIYWT